MCEGIFSFSEAHSRSEPLLDTSGLHCQFIWCDGCFTREHEDRYLTVLHSIFVACLDPRSMRCSLLCFGCSADLIFSILSRSCNIASSRGRVINRLSLSPGVIILYGLKALWQWSGSRLLVWCYIHFGLVLKLTHAHSTNDAPANLCTLLYEAVGRTVRCAVVTGSNGRIWLAFNQRRR